MTFFCHQCERTVNIVTSQHAIQCQYCHAGFLEEQTSFSNDYRSAMSNGRLYSRFRLNPLAAPKLDRMQKARFAPKICCEQSKEETLCTPCMEGFQPNETLFRLECAHVFHRRCILPWLRRSRTCPNCRSAVNVKM
ncbi:ring finger domain-containing protein [Ditylenchus destructor]|uniref:RING-type E3 ubiquitin transferase n=1 Tax=Ditylenchus destructor TaxID=166010 RepID=A0AAD4R570_9BILA|nr:ring finger domain-containing protein [Ditylenchus destructor]